MPPLPKVTVIIPTYNRWPHVCDAIDSVLAQSYQNTQCLVVDDASSDSSFEKLKNKYKDKIIIIKNKKNMDKSASRNQGILSYHSDFICFLDSDDLLTEDSVKLRLNIFLEDSSFTGVAYGLDTNKSNLLNQKQKDDTLTIEEYIYNYKWLDTNSFLIMRKTIMDVGMFNPNLTNREDIELFIRLLFQLEFRFCGGIVSQVREVDTKRARNNYAKIIAQGNNLSKALLANQDISHSLESTIAKIKQDEYNEMLRAYYYSKRYTEFRSFFKDGLRQGLLRQNIKTYKRYILSYLKGILT